MTAPSIVCGVDESQHARTALMVADRLARGLGLRLVAVHVTTHTHGAATPVRSAPASAGEQAHRDPRGLIGQILAEQGVIHAEPRALRGDAAECLADAADDELAELIVVGSRGLGSFRETFLGSVSNALVGIARCPVLVVPPGAVPGACDPA
jgi:nucleotide-binding universal stress UspA family protein